MTIGPADRRGLGEIVGHCIWTFMISLVLTSSILLGHMPEELWLGAYGLMVSTLIARSSPSAAHRSLPGDRTNLISIMGYSVSAICTGMVAVSSEVKFGTIGASLMIPFGLILTTLLPRFAKRVIDNSAVEAIEREGRSER